MKIRTLLLSIFAASSSLCACMYSQDLTSQIPEIDLSASYGFQKIPNVAQYGGADWSQAVGIARGITLKEAYEIAAKMPTVTYFFHMKGYSMVLDCEEGNHRRFGYGDAVFFTGTPWWGSAPGLADGYVRIEN